MYNADDLFDKIHEIETLIRKKTNPDGSFTFDPKAVMISLELTRRMISDEKENCD